MPLADRIAAAPDRLRRRIAANLPAAAAEYNAAIVATLGESAGPGAPARDGAAPRRRSGRLLAGTKAIAHPASLSVKITTTAVGAHLDRAGHPWVRSVVAKAAAAARRRLLAR